MADGHRARADLDVGDGAVARPQAPPPVFMMAGAVVKPHRSRPQPLLARFLGLGLEVAAVDGDLAVRADELDAVDAGLPALDDHAVRVAVGDVLRAALR